MRKATEVKERMNEFNQWNEIYNEVSIKILYSDIEEKIDNIIDDVSSLGGKDTGIIAFKDVNVDMFIAVETLTRIVRDYTSNGFKVKTRVVEDFDNEYNGTGKCKAIEVSVSW